MDGPDQGERHDEDVAADQDAAAHARGDDATAADGAAELAAAAAARGLAGKQVRTDRLVDGDVQHVLVEPAPDPSLGRRAVVGALAVAAVLGVVGAVAGLVDATIVQGISIGGALLLIAVALVLASTRLLPEELVVQQRHEAGEVSTVEGVRTGPALGRRSILVAGASALAAVGTALLLPVRGIGPSAGDTFRSTPWRQGSRAVDERGEPVRADTVPVNGIVTVWPEEDVGGADSQTVLLRVTPPALSAATIAMGTTDGLVAYSKICTHAGCPIGQFSANDREPRVGYELVCPCHQSRFDVTEQAKPVGGPATRPLAQLPITVDEDGVVVALGGFDQPPGAGVVVTMIEGLATWLDERLRIAGFVESARTKVFPTHWSFLLGELALYTLVVVIVSGTLLTFFYVPSSEEVVYQGSYAPLQGLEISRAFESVLHISFDVPGGLLIRQVHHWGALLFVAATTAHLARVFFTGAFRKPRELNWVIGVTLLLIAMGLGFTGYSLPDDLLSGTGLVIAWSILKAVPVVGADLATAAIGGPWPGQELVARLYPLHIFVLPGALVGLLAAHLAILWRQKHTHEPGPGSTEQNIIGERLWPHYVLKSGAVFFASAGALVLLGGAFQINPVWLYGPYLPADVTTAAQPDWYIGFLEGALRLFPGWEFRGLGATIPNPFFPGVLMPGVAFGLLYGVPWIHRRLTGDHEPHHRIERPRDAPVRTGIGVAVIVGYVVLLLAGGQELIANQLGMPVDRLTLFLQIMIVLGPPLAGWFAWNVTRSLRSGDPHPLRGDPAVLLVRTDDGGYTTEPIRPITADDDQAEDDQAGDDHATTGPAGGAP